MGYIYIWKFKTPIETSNFVYYLDESMLEINTYSNHSIVSIVLTSNADFKVI